MPNIGFWDWVIIFGIVLLFFGAKRLPDLTRSIGKSITAFKRGMKEAESEPESDLDPKKEKDKKDNQFIQ